MKRQANGTKKNDVPDISRLSLSPLPQTTRRTTGNDRASSRSQASGSNTRLCRFFALHGNCRYGDNCIYSHSLPDNMTWKEAKKQIPCPYFAQGCCRYGNHCQLRHDDASSSQQDDQDSATVCGICLERTLQIGHKFGLLSCCNHTFCFECLMEWRKEGSNEAQDRRSCPTCRKHSDYVVPSTKLPTTDEEKEQIVQEYRAQLSRIPCRRFDGTLGSCLYGRDCFYAHLSPNGTDLKEQDQSMEELYEKRHRRRVGRSLDHDIRMLGRLLLLLDMYGSRGLGVWSDDEDDDNDSEDDQPDDIFWWSTGS